MSYIEHYTDFVLDIWLAEVFLMCGPTNLDTAIFMYNPSEKNSEKKGKMSIFCEPVSRVQSMKEN